MDGGLSFVAYTLTQGEMGNDDDDTVACKVSFEKPLKNVLGESV